jgi:hypothetical protein
VTSKRKAFRSTDAYRVGVKTAQADAKAQAAAARELAKAERVAQRAAAKHRMSAGNRKLRRDWGAAAGPGSVGGLMRLSWRQLTP